MTGYVDDNLNPGELVVYRAGVTWIVFLVPIALLGFGFTLAMTGVQYGLILTAAGAATLLSAWLRQSNSEFAVTTNRVILKTGFASRRTIEMKLSRVESVQVDQDLFGRLLNYGTIMVIGTGGTREPFTLIDNPQGFRRAVQVEQQ
jgi:uncharacterized membrane protein YdbT with pleckstrin-like domain